MAILLERETFLGFEVLGVSHVKIGEEGLMTVLIVNERCESDYVL